MTGLEKVFEPWERLGLCLIKCDHWFPLGHKPASVNICQLRTTFSNSLMQVSGWICAVCMPADSIVCCEASPHKINNRLKWNSTLTALMTANDNAMTWQISCLLNELTVCKRVLSCWWERGNGCFVVTTKMRLSDFLIFAKLFECKA